jgi:cyclophilin family peptidyl-prolyl cis-trans isomerase
MKWLALLLLILIACAQPTKVSDETTIDEIEKVSTEVKEMEKEAQEIELIENASAEIADTPMPTEEKNMNTIVELQTTMGTMKIRLFDDKAPKTVQNFKDLVNKGFYDGTVFHRVIKNFMIQGGDPKGTGTGGPGYTIKDEFGAGLTHSKKGILSMANAGPNSGGSQFFITLIATPWLDGKHAIFGELAEGVDVLDKIGTTPTDASDRPMNEVRIVKAKIVQ